MLKSIDILLGLSIVMLVASMAVTVLTQIWTALCNTRGTHLRDGLAGLLQHIAPALGSGEAQTVIGALLRHPLISENGRLGSLVHREEFTRLLLDLASGESPENSPMGKLRAALRENGIADAGCALGKIRDKALELERSNPEMGSGARHDLAIIEAAGSQFVAKVNGWFDQTIDRISARFAFTTRQVALALAFFLAMAIQLDTVALINRLAADDGLRGSLVQQAYANDKLPLPDRSLELKNIESLAGRKLFAPPSSWPEWRSEWGLAKIPGILLSTLLLSLGAPFWFEALKNLLRLRSAIAVKDDGQRERRQSAITTPVTF